MWQYIIEQLTAAKDIQSNIFWPDVDKETERAMLLQLFTAAVARNELTSDQAAQFLLEVWAMNAPGSGNTIAQLSSLDLDAATRNLLNMDEKLSLLSLALFERRLLSDLDRETLKQDLESQGKLTTTSGAPVSA